MSPLEGKKKKKSDEVLSTLQSIFVALQHEKYKDFPSFFLNFFKLLKHELTLFFPTYFTRKSIKLNPKSFSLHAFYLVYNLVETLLEFKSFSSSAILLLSLGFSITTKKYRRLINYLSLINE